VIHVDSSYLIDLHREQWRKRPGPAFELIESLDDRELLGLSAHVVCELRAGAEQSRNVLREHELVDELIAGFHIAYPDDRFPGLYGRLYAATTGQRRPVAAFDLLIATAALLADAPLVTKNVKDFERVPGLRVLSY